MSNLGFVDILLDNVNKFYSAGMNQMDFMLKLMGTDVEIIRTDDDSEGKDVFGTNYSSNLIGDEHKQSFKYKILINMNDMRKIYQQSADSFEVYDNQQIMKLGDIVKFSRGTKEYLFKIVDVQAFSEAAQVLYRYQLNGYQEVQSLLNSSK